MFRFKFLPVYQIYFQSTVSISLTDACLSWSSFSKEKQIFEKNDEIKPGIVPLLKIGAPTRPNHKRILGEPSLLLTTQADVNEGQQKDSQEQTMNEQIFNHHQEKQGDDDDDSFYQSDDMDDDNDDQSDEIDYQGQVLLKGTEQEQEQEQEQEETTFSTLKDVEEFEKQFEGYSTIRPTRVFRFIQPAPTYRAIFDGVHKLSKLKRIRRSSSNCVQSTGDSSSNSVHQVCCLTADEKPIKSRTGQSVHHRNFVLYKFFCSQPS